MRRGIVHFRALSAPRWVESMRAYFGPAIEAFHYSGSPASQKALADEMEALIRQHNHAENDTVLSGSEYLEIIGTRRHN